MNWLVLIFGEGKDLTAFQMICRAVLTFLICLVLIRLSGRRSFGLKTPLDNIIAVLLGALLSRAVVGASPFVPVVTSSAALVIMHRAFGWLIVHHKKFGEIVEGKKICLFRNNEFIKENMDKALVCEEDIMQGVRKSALTDDLNKIEAIYMERNGQISPVKKDP